MTGELQTALNSAQLIEHCMTGLSGKKFAFTLSTYSPGPPALAAKIAPNR